MSQLAGRRIVLGVTGGIAAYKSADLVRRLRDAGASVRVVLTHGGAAFVQPLTFQAVSGQPVHQDLLDPEAEAGMGHIELARWADDILVVPASAHFLARLAQGLADDLLTTLCLATDARISLAPAMNRLMWANPATQANRERLQARGVRLLGPGEGDQACGEVGAGRMWEPEEIIAGLPGTLSGPRLDGVLLLITAGPTREALDPVRYITNRSTGRMGFALAAAALERGASVVLIAGPSAEPTPTGAERIDVESAEQMHAAVMARVADTQVFIAAAAVADYRAAETATRKLKKDTDDTAGLNLALVRTPDILASVGALTDNRPFVVGFAAETDDLLKHAEAKRQRKGADMVAANWVGRPGSGFDSERNALEVLWEGGHASLSDAPKPELARALMQLISERYHE